MYLFEGNYIKLCSLVGISLRLNLKKGQGWWGWDVVSRAGMVILPDSI